jgi:hypothetical protein
VVEQRRFNNEFIFDTCIPRLFCCLASHPYSELFKNVGLSLSSPRVSAND